jgi:type IV pilus assembly protein PilX
MVLVSSLLLLLVVTIMALSMFHSFGIQEKIAGNTREKQRAVQAATTVHQYAEWWLVNVSPAAHAVNANVPSSADTVCSGAIVATATLGGQICTVTLTSTGNTPTNVPWTNPPIGVAYTPPGMNITGAVVNPAVPDVYAAQPYFYIADLGLLPTGRGEVYQIDAYSYGLNDNTLAVIESTVAISCIVCNPGAL